jgi:hypothetical protein
MATKTADQWFDEYGVSHQNRVNKAIHWICVPLIAACVIAFFWEIPAPAFLSQIPYLNWATLLLAATMVFYVRLSIPLAIGMMLFWTIVILGIVFSRSAIPVDWPDLAAGFRLPKVGDSVLAVRTTFQTFFGKCEYTAGHLWQQRLVRASTLDNLKHRTQETTNACQAPRKLCCAVPRRPRSQPSMLPCHDCDKGPIDWPRRH